MRAGLFSFILISALLHAIIISMQDEWIFSISEYHEQGGSSLDIEITSEKKTLQPLKTGAQTEKKPVKPPEILPAPSPLNIKPLNSKNIKPPVKKIKTVEQQQTSIAKIQLELKKTASINPETITEKNANKLNNNKANNNEANNNEELETLLNNELAKHFYYPKAAQRKNRQGRVILAFTINPDGLIENIHIDKSSGYSTLDTAAIKALNKIDASKDFARALNGHNTELTVPINYRLLNH
ncbi:hypothetical protein MNBD_GAMMA11-1442 [hydrothermal vent metagenome]|uniref:TonB C-terminal domain-containing protein n=1 Tax=hydrothermal vent metagenome TaxID=652676 RepID=A0A3B0WRG5_9ZZZZ